MCLFNMPSMPSAPPIPRIPQPDSFLAMDRADEVRKLAAARGGSSANMVSDLTPSDVRGVKPVLLGN
jgi:hypothetical protein